MTLIGVRTADSLHLAVGSELSAIGVGACADEVASLHSRIGSIADEANFEGGDESERHLRYLAPTRALARLPITVVEPRQELSREFFLQPSLQPPVRGDASRESA